LIGWISRSSPLAKASLAPSATTMIEKSLPRSWRRVTSRQISSTVVVCSGMTMQSAPPAIPA
jgi:hypothetical protein